MEFIPLPHLTNQCLLGRPYALPDPDQDIWPQPADSWDRLYAFLGCEARVGVEYALRFLQDANGLAGGFVTATGTGRLHEQQIGTDRSRGLIAVLAALELDTEQRVLASLPRDTHVALSLARARHSEPIAGAILVSPDREKVGLWRYGNWELNPFRCGRLALIGDVISNSERVNWNEGPTVALYRALFSRLRASSFDVIEAITKRLVAHPVPLHTRSYLTVSSDPPSKTCHGALAVAESDRQWDQWVQSVALPPAADRYGSVAIMYRDDLIERLRDDALAVENTRREIDEDDPVARSTRVYVNDDLTNAFSQNIWRASRHQATETGKFPLLKPCATPFADGHGSLIARLLDIDPTR